MSDVPHFLQMQSAFFPFMGAIIFSLLHFYIYKSLLKSLSTKANIRIVWKIFTICNALCCIAYIFLRDIPTPQELYFLLSLALGVCFLLFFATLLYQCASVGFIALRSHKSRSKMRNRTKLCAFFVSLFIFGYGIYHNYHIAITYLRLEIDGLSVPLKVALLSDIHIGGLIERTEVRKIVQKVNALEPDIIVLVGDIVDARLNDVESAVNELTSLKSTYGVFYVLGNHEYFHDIDNIINKMRDLDFNVLLNESYKIEDMINIAGITDFVGIRLGYLQPDLHKALNDCDAMLPTILLSHQPRIIYDLRADLPNDKIALVLSGHTHGGQIFPFGYAMLLQQPFIKGLHTLKNFYQTKVYVSEGTGFWGPPLRLLSQREITLLVLNPTP